MIESCMCMMGYSLSLHASWLHQPVLHYLFERRLSTKSGSGNPMNLGPPGCHLQSVEKRPCLLHVYS